MMAAYYPTKKALKEAVGQPLHYGETSMFGREYPAGGNGTVTVVGPSEYQRKWFATVALKDGKIAAVK